ncbi:hypothetical protein MKZ38_002569 [Zalerion maritima]|uniref:Protein kinase domain-containing protein n=1 Tax=Zalerion maritima TaxID=339359 RepID=A0AAD5WQQ2_9PEZI|nr:hypothetical protein MKZ38_002569 [Zalerion maritima]
MAYHNALPYFLRPKAPDRQVGTNSSDLEGENTLRHLDLLGFLSATVKFGVDISIENWVHEAPGLPALGGGGTSIVNQARIDDRYGLAFKTPRSAILNSTGTESTEQSNKNHFRALIYELVALESLRDSKHVIDLVGVSWHVDEVDQVWPVLLTEQSRLGTLAAFLDSEYGKNASFDRKLKICTDVAKACVAMHRVGIIYGDLKPENILVFNEPDGFSARAIDFGYSSFGAGASTEVRVPRTRPYQAPEHEMDKLVTWDAAQKMDLFSFGFLVCRVLIWDECMAAAARLGVVGSNSMLDGLDELKSSKSFLVLVLGTVDSCSSIPREGKNLVQEIFRGTLNHDPSRRANDFEQMVNIMDPGYELKFDPGQKVNLKEMLQSVAEIGDILSDMDTVDYKVRQAIFLNLRRRTASHEGCACFGACVKQLSISYEIGFGTKRNAKAAAKWRSKCDGNQETLEHSIKSLGDRYNTSMQARVDRIGRLIGYSTGIPVDFCELYRSQDRLDEAEKVVRREVQGREQSMGNNSRSYLYQLTTLSIVLWNKGQHKQSIQTAEAAALVSKETYGEQDVLTVGCHNYFAYILFCTGRFAEAEGFQTKLIQTKKQQLGSSGGVNRTYATSVTMLVATYYMQGKYDKCLTTAEELLEAQMSILGIENPETLNTRSWICHARLALGDMDGLLAETRDIVRLNKVLLGRSDQTRYSQELLSRVLLAMAKPEPDAQIVEEYLDESLEIVVGVIDELEDPEGIFGSDSGQEEVADAVEGASDEKGESLWEETVHDQVEVDLMLHLLVSTTLLCGLGFKRDFDLAREHTHTITEGPFLEDKLGDNHPDKVKFLRVVEYLRDLEHIINSDTGEEADERRAVGVGELLWKLAHSRGEAARLEVRRAAVRGAIIRWAAHLGLDVLKYAITYPWRHTYFSVAMTVSDPEEYLSQWIGIRQAEYKFIGLLGSVISAVVAQLFSSPLLVDPPWTSLAALSISLTLSPMAVVAALHHTVFLNAVLFEPGLDARLKRVFGTGRIRVAPGCPGEARRSEKLPGLRRRLWLSTFVFGIPQLLLSYSIIASFAGIGLMITSPLWTRENNAVWERPQMTACAGVRRKRAGRTRKKRLQENSAVQRQRWVAVLAAASQPPPGLLFCVVGGGRWQSGQAKTLRRPRKQKHHGDRSPPKLTPDVQVAVPRGFRGVFDNLTLLSRKAQVPDEFGSQAHLEFL